jgi:hypothetical protein
MVVRGVSGVKERKGSRGDQFHGTAGFMLLDPLGIGIYWRDE